MQTVASEYKTSYHQLKDQKLEIEHLHHLLDQARHRLTRDFEHWFESVYMPPAGLDRNDSGLSVEGELTAVNAGRLAREKVKVEKRVDVKMEKGNDRPRVGSSSVQDDIKAFYRARENIKMKIRD
jgi:hypothetical protein